MEEQKSIFDALTPKQTFIMGLVGGFLILCTIGFFVLLNIFLKGNGFTGQGTTTQAAPAAAAPTPAAPAAAISLSPVTDKDWYKGVKNPVVTIVEFSDTECPYCKQFHATMNQIIEEYGDKVKWVYRHAPITSIHPKATREAHALECAGELGGNTAFWKYTDRIYEITPGNNKLEDAQLFDIATFVGLNKNAFTTCLESGKYNEKITGQTLDAQKAGLRGTPHSVIVKKDGSLVPLSGAQPYESVAAAIEQYLK